MRITREQITKFKALDYARRAIRGGADEGAICELFEVAIKEGRAECAADRIQAEAALAESRAREALLVAVVKKALAIADHPLEADPADDAASAYELAADCSSISEVLRAALSALEGK